MHADPTEQLKLSDRERERRQRQRKLSRILREVEMLEFTGLKKSMIAVLIKDGKFPKPLKLTEAGRSKGWLESELIDWQESRIAARDVA